MRKSRVALAVGCACAVAACGPQGGVAAQGETSSGTGSSGAWSSSGLSGSDTTAADGTTQDDPCTEVYEGDLLFCSNECASGAVDQVEDVRHLRRITGRLLIEHTDLEDLSPFACLEEVGTLYISENPNLKNLGGLERLASVEGAPPFPTGVIVMDNPELETLAGLSSIHDLEGLAALGNDALTSISLDHVEHIGRLTLGGCGMYSSNGSTPSGPNPSLSSMDGFPDLQSVDALSVNGQTNLSSIARLQEIADAGGHFGTTEFRYNENLDVADIDAFMTAAGSTGDVCGNLGGEQQCQCAMPGG